MKFKLCLGLTVATMLMGCTHASVSKVPEMVNGQEVYTYTGRANFGFQMSAADDKMTEVCDNMGKRPQVVDRSTQDLGPIVSANRNSASVMGNQNQVVRFTCVER